MAIRCGTRTLFRSPVANMSIAVAMMFTTSVQPSHAASSVFATFSKAGSIVSGSPILTLNVPDGKYAIFGKINLDQDDAGLLKTVTVECSLRAGTNVDWNVIRLASSGIDRVDNGSMSFQIVEDISRSEIQNINLTCNYAITQSSLLSFRFARITAIKLDGQLCAKTTPANCL